MKKPSMLIIALLLASSAALAQVARPGALWFNKVISVDRSRQLYVGLNANMWVFYDLPTAILYQAWVGGATGGAFVTAAPQTVTSEYWFWNGTPQFPHVWRSSGTNYFKDSVSEYFATYTKPADITTHYTKWPKQPLNAVWGGPYRSWSVLSGATNLNATVRFRGYTVTSGNVFTLKFGLILPNNGGEIKVTESPEYSNLPSGNHLVRTFTFTGIPAGDQVRLEHMGGTNAGAWSVTSGSATISGGMVQTADGTTILNGSF